MDWSNIRNIIEQAESINELILIKEFVIEKDDDESWEEIYNNWDMSKIILKDGTEVELEKYSGECFNEKNDHWYFYYIPSIDTYICAECGLWQKSYRNIKNDIGYEEYGVLEKLLPHDWSLNGVIAYLKKGIQLQKEWEKRREENRAGIEQDEFFNGDCSNCIHMKQFECEYGNEEYSEEQCEDWEGR